MGDVIRFIGKMIPSRFNKYQTSNVKREIALLEIEIKRHVWHFFNYKSPFLGGAQSLFGSLLHCRSNKEYQLYTCF